MPRVHHTKAAQKDIPGTDIKKGDSYYWWKFYRAGKSYSKTPPNRSRLTRSEFRLQVYGIEDQMAGLSAEEGLKDGVDDVVQALRDLASECEEKRENMPDGLRDGDTGQLLEERAEACNAAADELEQIDFDDRGDDEDEEEFWQRKLDEVQAVSVEAS